MSAQSACYIKIGDLQGECKDTKHPGWIDVDAWDNGLTQPASLHQGGGGGVGKARVEALSFLCAIERCCPTLMVWCAKGKHVPMVTLSCCKAGGGGQEYQHIELEDCMISSFDVIADGGFGVVAEVGIEYAKITVEVREQRPDGGMGAGVVGIFDVKNNTVA